MQDNFIIPQTYYVYTYGYPDGTIFYVGKGTNGRVADHEREASKGCKCRKCRVIREIWADGKPVQKRIVFETLSESEAFEHEKAMIELYASSQLINIKDNPYVEVQEEKPEVTQQPLETIHLPTEVVSPVKPVQSVEPLIHDEKLRPKPVYVIFTPEQAAEMLGVKQPRTVINLAKQGKIPSFRVGDLWKFYRSDIQAYIDEQRKRHVRDQTEEEDS